MMLRTQRPTALRRRSVHVLGLLTVMAAAFAFLRIGTPGRGFADPPKAAEPAHGAATICHAGMLLESRREWPLTIHRDPFRWEDVFNQPLPQEAPAAHELEQEARAKIRLQAVMLGDVPRALINGELRTEGDSIAGFHVERIERRSVIVEKSGIRVELTF